MAKKFPGGKAVHKALNGVLNAKKTDEMLRRGTPPEEIIAHAESNGMRLSQKTKQMLRV